MGEGLINAGFGRHCRTSLAGGKRDATGGDKHESDAETSVLTQALQRARNRLLYVIYCTYPQFLIELPQPILYLAYELTTGHVEADNNLAICPDSLKT